MPTLDEARNFKRLIGGFGNHLLYRVTLCEAEALSHLTDSRLCGPVGNIRHDWADVYWMDYGIQAAAIPGIDWVATSRLAILMNPDYAQDQAQWEVLERAARSLNLTLQAVVLRQRNDLGNGFAKLRRERPDALFGLRNPQTLLYRKPIVDFAAEERLPAIYTTSDIAEAGGLMSYGPNRADLFRRAATYVTKILNGAKAADLPIEQPTKFELVINLKTAKALGITIPPSVSAIADEVIE